MDEMREQIAAGIKRRRNDSDSKKRMQWWRKIPCARNMTTAEEWLKYGVEKLETDVP